VFPIVWLAAAAWNERGRGRGRGRTATATGRRHGWSLDFSGGRLSLLAGFPFTVVQYSSGVLVQFLTTVRNRVVCEVTVCQSRCRKSRENEFTTTAKTVSPLRHKKKHKRKRKTTTSTQNNDRKCNNNNNSEGSGAKGDDDAAAAAAAAAGRASNSKEGSHCHCHDRANSDGNSRGSKSTSSANALSPPPPRPPTTAGASVSTTSVVSRLLWRVLFSPSRSPETCDRCQRKHLLLAAKIVVVTGRPEQLLLWWLRS